MYNTLVDIKKTRYKKLVTHVESHASAVSLLESGEWRYMNVIKNSNNHVVYQGWDKGRGWVAGGDCWVPM